jgi:sugar phosphate isomerase/epimerase
MARIPIALQLYSVRDDCARDLEGVLDAVAKMGYEGVEFAGYYGRDAATLRKLLDDRGLKVAGAHVGIDTLLGDQLEKSIEFHKTLGNKFLIVPGLPHERIGTKDAFLQTAQTMNGIAAKLRPHGMQTGYHNHDFEFKPYPGTSDLPWDVFFGNTDKDVVMQFDTGNALHAGAEALPFLQRYPGRATTVHLKEFAPNNDKALIGEGVVPFDRIFAVCESTGGTQWYIVEQESYAYPPLECVDKCLQNLKAMGK